MIIHLIRCESCQTRGYHAWAHYIVLVKTDIVCGLTTKVMKLCKTCIEVFKPVIIEYWGLAEWERLDEAGNFEEIDSISK